jgi:hypothetical protein
MYLTKINIMSHQSEAVLENNLIKQLRDLSMRPLKYKMASFGC